MVPRMSLSCGRRYHTLPLHLIPFTFSSNTSLPWPSDLSLLPWRLNRNVIYGLYRFTHVSNWIENCTLVWSFGKGSIYRNSLPLIVFLSYIVRAFEEDSSNLPLSKTTNSRLEFYIIRRQSRVINRTTKRGRSPG